jgi:hypothetical protein
MAIDASKAHGFPDVYVFRFPQPPSVQLDNPDRAEIEVPVTAGSIMELGIYTFGDITPDPNTRRAISTKQRYAEILAAAKLAD